VSKASARGKRPADGKPVASSRPSRSPQAVALRRRRARRVRWTIAGAAAAALAAVIAVIAVVAGGRGTGTTGSAGGSLPAAGSLAPAGSFTTAAGTTATISSLRGHPVLVWLVTTWCPGCQAGTQAMPADLASLRARGIKVVELEDYADLGQPGPDIASFGQEYAGAAYHSPGWVFGTASQTMTQAYNPQGYLDIYYLLDSAGRIAYINSGPTSTMTQLLAHAGRLT
jgi:thiol-disulfide isomerase/thioredoxin